MIFDFDVHHGNGTNDMFFEDPSVLFVSTHQANIYPGTGSLKEVGKGDGEGASINLPLPGQLSSSISLVCCLIYSALWAVWTCSWLSAVLKVLPADTTGDSGDAAMMEVFDEIVGPAAERFQPDIILVSTLFKHASQRFQQYLMVPNFSKSSYIDCHCH